MLVASSLSLVANVFLQVLPVWMIQMVHPIEKTKPLKGVAWVNHETSEFVLLGSLGLCQVQFQVWNS